MVIEHTFVTTLPPEQAMHLASNLLASGGFRTNAQQAFGVSQLGGGGGGDPNRWTSLQAQRGRTSAARAKDPTEAPQVVRLEWDRGRVTVAATIETAGLRGRSFAIGPVYDTTPASGRRAKPYADLMLAIAQDVDDLLTGRVTPDQAGDNWFAIEQALKEKGRRARRRAWIIFGVLVFLIVAATVTTVVVATSHHGY